MRLRHPWTVVVLLAAGLAAWMGLGSLHDFQHADSLLTVLISTQRWTPFFWGQDRFGMLVPLLAMTIRHPLANLLAQGWMMTAAALLAPFAMARFLSGRSGAWLAIGAGADVLFLLLTTPEVQFDWLVTQPYALSIALGFAALTVAADREGGLAIAAAFVLLTLAAWVNIGIAVVLAIATVIAGRRRLRLLVLLAAATAIASLAAKYLASAHTTTALAPAAQWPDGWRKLLVGSRGITANPAAVLGIALLAMLAAARLWQTRSLPPSTMLWAIAAMAAGSWLVVGTSLWVAMNRYLFRYMYPTWMIVGVGVAAVFAALFAKRTNALSAAALAALIGLTIVRYGVPSLARVDRGLDNRYGRQTAAVLRNGVTVIGGDYWRVWPAVFHANLALARTHAHARVYGLAYRSEDGDRLWKRAGQPIAIAGWSDDPSLPAIAARHGIATTLRTRLPGMDLYTGLP